MASVYWSTSRSARSPTPPFKTPLPQCKRSTDSTTSCRQLVRRPFPDGRHRDETGQVRLTVNTMSWEAYVHLAFDEIRLAGAGSPPVTRRLKAALTDLKSVAPRERIEILDLQLDLLTIATEASLTDDRDVALALNDDREGIGAAAGLSTTGRP